MKINVAVMFGGKSVEHEVSVISALQAIEAMDRSKYNIVPVYISKNSEIYSGEKLLDIEAYRDLDQLIKGLDAVYLYKDGQHVYMNNVKQKLFGSKPQVIDLVIPVMHGTNGEDGVLQGYLEMLGLPFAGSDTTGSAVGQDKVIMKHIFENSNIPIVKWFWLYDFEYEDNKEEYYAQAEAIGYPVVVKPANLGSSIGITFAANNVELHDAILIASEFDAKIVVEKAVENLREVNCSVLGDVYDNDTSVIEEVSSHEDFLTFDEKYLQNAKSGKSSGMASTKREVPANLDAALEAKVRELSKAVVRVLGSSGVCRIDFMIDGKTNEVYVNEINSMPGSLAFYLWSPKDVSFAMIMDNLVKQAIDRERRNSRKTFTYSSNILSNYAANGTKGKLKI